MHSETLGRHIGYSHDIDSLFPGPGENAALPLRPLRKLLLRHGMWVGRSGSSAILKRMPHWAGEAAERKGEGV